MLIEAIASSKKATLAAILPEMHRDRLKELCARLGLDDISREKQPLVDRLMGQKAVFSNGSGDSARPTPQLGLFSPPGEPDDREPPPSRKPSPTPAPDSPRVFGGFSEITPFIWSVADLLRGDYKQSEYGKVVLPMTVLRRLDCVLAPKKNAVLERFADLKRAKTPDATMDRLLLHTSGMGLYNVSKFDFSKLKGDPSGIRANVGNYVRGFSEGAKDVFDRFKFDEQIGRLDDADLLYKVVAEFAKVDLHPDHVSNHMMGSIFEELIRRFSEQSNETAGEHFTPREVIRLMVDLLFIEDDDGLRKPGIVRTLFDPACGTGGMLSVAETRLRELNPRAELEVFGQELNDESYAICKSDMLIKGQGRRQREAGQQLLRRSIHRKTLRLPALEPSLRRRMEEGAAVRGRRSGA